MVRSWLVLALFGVALAIGCSGEGSVEGVVPVSGTVTQKGAPLAGASVGFAPTGEGGKAASGKTDATGRFKLTTLKADDGALPGDYSVTVSKTELVGKQYTQEEANQYYNEHKKSPPSPEIKKLVAEKFSKIDATPLKATVKKGDKNDFTFDVE